MNDDLTPTPPGQTDVTAKLEKNDPILEAADPYYEPYFCDTIKALAEEMMFPEQWAADIGVTEMIMFDWISKFPEFAEAYNIAMTALRAAFTSEIVSVARGGKKDANAVLYALIAKKRFHDLYGDHNAPAAPAPFGGAGRGGAQNSMQDVTPAINDSNTISGVAISDMKAEQLHDELKLLRDRHK